MFILPAMDFDSQIHQTKKKRCNLEEEEDGSRNWADSLPREISLEIVSRLPVTSLLQFRFVCKAWRRLSHDPHLVHLHLSRAVEKNPCLIFHSDYPIQNQLYFLDSLDDGGGDGDGDGDVPRSRPKVRKICIPFGYFLSEFSVVGSCNGLLCLSNSLFPDSIVIYNPVTRQHKELPKSRQFQEQEVVLGFGFHPLINEYKVVKTVSYRNRYDEPWPTSAAAVHHGHFRQNQAANILRTEIRIYDTRSNRWRSIGEAPYQVDQRAKGVLVNGRLHWVSRVGKFNGLRSRLIVSLDLVDERFREISRPDCVGKAMVRTSTCLVDFGGRLSAAFRSSTGAMEIWVMEEYDVGESWIKEYSIEPYSLAIPLRDFLGAQGIWNNALCRREVRVIGLLKSGEILMEYKWGALVSYDPTTQIFKDLKFEGMPTMFQVVQLVGSLNWIDTPSHVP